MISVRLLAVSRLAIFLVLGTISLLGCDVFELVEDSKQGVAVYCMNITTSNFHIGFQNGLRVKKGEVSELLIAFVWNQEETKIRNLCRDYGCFAKIEIKYKGDPDPESDGPYQDTVVVVEDDKTGALSVYSLLGFVDVSITEIY